MVKQARFSIPLDDHALRGMAGGMNAYEDLDELVGDDHLPPARQRGRPRRADRKTPVDKQSDRRHLAGSDWLTDPSLSEGD
jgi:hypothetical protein